MDVLQILFPVNILHIKIYQKPKNISIYKNNKEIYNMNTISIRLSDSERKILNVRATESGLTISNYVRKTIFDKNITNPYKYQSMNILFEISTDINKYKTFEDKRYFDNIEKGVEKLWEILL